MADVTKEKKQRSSGHNSRRHSAGDDADFLPQQEETESVNARHKADDCEDNSQKNMSSQIRTQSDIFDVEDDFSPEQNIDGQEFVIRISKSLHRKINSQAQDEGLTLQEFAAELLTEGVVVRAWEIVERKNQMRGLGNTQPSNRSSGANSSNSHNNSNSNSNSNGAGQYGRNPNNRKQQHHRGGMSHTRYQSIMDDKATFLEYVRQQERNRR